MRKLSLAVSGFMGLIAVGSAANAALTPGPGPIPVSIPSSTVTAWQTQNAGLPTTPFRIPLDMPVAAPLVPGQEVQAAFVPYANDVVVTKNNAFGILMPMLSAVQSTKTASVPVANTSPQQPAYEQDGDAVTSCDEWVYKKYYDYRRFQDAAATCGGSSDCVYNLWLQASTPGEQKVMSPRSLLVNVMSPYPTSTLDPEPLQATQTGITQQLKNPLRDPKSVAAFVQSISDAMFVSTDANTTAALDAVGTYLNSPAFTTSSPYYTIQGARAAWHSQMHDQQAGYQESAWDRTLASKRVANLQGLLNAYENAQAYDLSRAEQWEGNVERICGGLFKSLHPCTPTNPCKPTPPPSAACLQARAQYPEPTSTYAAATSLAQALVAEWNNLDRVTGAVDHGCLGVDHNKCDWSPDMIVKEYLTTIDSQVTADLALCDGVLGTSSANQLTSVESAALSDEIYFQIGLGKMQEQVAEVKADLNWSQTSPDTVHYDLFGGPGSWQIGGSFAGAGYSQQGYWEIRGEKNAAEQLCYLAGRSYAGASANVSLFGQTATILDADYDIAIGEAPSTTGGPATDSPGYFVESHMNIFGQAIYTPINASGSVGNFNVPIVSAGFNQTVLDVPGQISFLSLDLQAQLRANLSGSLTGTAPAACGQVQSATQAAYALGVTITPSLSAVAIGTALVGALGTGVGVQGTVDLLTVSSPITVGSGVGSDSNGNVALTLNANASLDIEVLAGELDAAECIVGQCATQQLFAWSGIPAFNQSLWSLSESFPIVAMQAALQ